LNAISSSMYRNLQQKILRRLTHRIRLARSLYIDDFYFIHINKTGGTSIEEAFRLPAEHLTAMEKRNQVGLERWRNAFKFTVVRNPWDKVVSHYHYRVKTNQGNLADSGMKFEDWVKSAYRDNNPSLFDNPKYFMPCVDWLTDSDNKLIVDYVGRFEHLSRDFANICEKIGLQVELPHRKVSSRDHYRGYYNSECRNIIGEHFIRDLEQFEYTF